MEMPSLHSIKARQASGAPLLKDCSVIITVFNGKGHLEEKTLLLFLCFVIVLMAALPSLSMEHAQALSVPSFHYVPMQSCCFFSTVSENLPLAFYIPKATTQIKPLTVSFLRFPLASDLPHTDICFLSTEDAGCDPFLSQVPSSSEVLC